DRRPERGDALGGAGVGEVYGGEAVAELRLLIPERRSPVERPEEIGLERGLRRPFAEHRLSREVETDARVPEVAVEEPLVDPWLDLGRPLGVLPLPETAGEQSAIVKEGGVDEAADGECRPLAE